LSRLSHAEGDGAAARFAWRDDGVVARFVWRDVAEHKLDWTSLNMFQSFAEPVENSHILRLRHSSICHADIERHIPADDWFISLRDFHLKH
jgi:hypothetical protein